MKHTDKEICRSLAALLARSGVQRAVVSPGSRNAPMILAITRAGAIATTVVVDERSAAFIALGMASASAKPVALVCTSGSAVLNYAPAVAEARYRGIPLIVVSADRPARLVDQAEPQTINQPGVLRNIVKHWCDISDNADTAFHLRLAADAVTAALTPPYGPVHINLHLDAPLGNLVDCPLPAPVPAEMVLPELSMSDVDATLLSIRLQRASKVMVLAGHMAPDEDVDAMMAALEGRRRSAVLAECQSNLQGTAVSNFDAVLARIDSAAAAALAPDIVITMGGSLVSGRIKEFLRSGACAATEHWHVGLEDGRVDTFGRLAVQLRVPPRVFLRAMVRELCRTDIPVASHSYQQLWHRYSMEALASALSEAESCPWSDFKAMSAICSMVPDDWCVQLSNGTAIRYAQIFRLKARRIDCNRGVSGIEGSTSTAVGASAVSSGTTLLITGDMSAQYDIAAFAAPCVDSRFKMVVLNNLGGGIFRCIPQTSSLPECEEYFAADVRLPLANICRGYGFSYYEASDPASLCSAFAAFASDCSSPAVLNVLTPPDASAEVFRKYHTAPI